MCTIEQLTVVTDTVDSPSSRATTAANRSDITWSVRSLGSKQQLTVVTDAVRSPSSRPQQQITVVTDIVDIPASRATTAANSSDLNWGQSVVSDKSS